MRLFSVNGRLVSKNVSKYLIKWDGQCKSKIQFQTKQFLKPFWRACIVYEEFPVYGTMMKVDILNATFKIAVEINGPQHSQLHYFHNNEPVQYLDSVKRDVKKMDWLKLNGFQLVEINFDEVPLLSTSFFKEKFNIEL